MSGEAKDKKAYAKNSRVGRDLQRYDEDKRRLVIGAIPVQEDGNIVLVSSAKHPGGWIFPKGGWESDETMEECALREALEEGGIKGTLQGQLGSKECRSKSGGSFFLHCFVLRVTELLPEWSEDVRKRMVVPLDEALQMVAKPYLKHFLEVFKAKREDQLVR